MLPLLQNEEPLGEGFFSSCDTKKCFLKKNSKLKLFDLLKTQYKMMYQVKLGKWERVSEGRGERTMQHTRQTRMEWTYVFDDQLSFIHNRRDV